MEGQVNIVLLIVVSLLSFVMVVSALVGSKTLAPHARTGPIASQANAQLTAMRNVATNTQLDMKDPFVATTFNMATAAKNAIKEQVALIKNKYVMYLAAQSEHENGLPYVEMAVLRPILKYIYFNWKNLESKESKFTADQVRIVMKVNVSVMEELQSNQAYMEAMWLSQKAVLALLKAKPVLVVECAEKDACITSAGTSSTTMSGTTTSGTTTTGTTTTGTTTSGTTSTTSGTTSTTGSLSTTVTAASTALSSPNVLSTLSQLVMDAFITKDVLTTFLTNPDIRPILEMVYQNTIVASAKPAAVRGDIKTQYQQMVNEVIAKESSISNQVVIRKTLSQLESSCQSHPIRIFLCMEFQYACEDTAATFQGRGSSFQRDMMNAYLLNKEAPKEAPAEVMALIQQSKDLLDKQSAELLKAYQQKGQEWFALARPLYSMYMAALTNQAIMINSLHMHVFSPTMAVMWQDIDAHVKVFTQVDKECYANTACDVATLETVKKLMATATVVQAATVTQQAATVTASTTATTQSPTATTTQTTSATTAWTNHPGASLTQLSHSDSLVCGVSGTNQLLCSSALDPTAAWKPSPGTFKHVSVDGKKACGVNPAGDIFCADDVLNPQWQQIPGNLKQIDLHSDVMCGVNSDDNIYCASFKQANWSQKPGQLKHLAVNSGRVCGVNAGNQIWCADNVHAPAWESVQGSLQQIDMDGDKVCGITPENTLVCAAYKSGDWKVQPQGNGASTHVSVGGAGNAYTVNKEGGVFYAKSLA